MFLLTNPGMTMRIRIAFPALLFAASSVWATEPLPAERMIAELQVNHIAANAPTDARFMELLQRDVRAYLDTNSLPAKSVKIEMLRRGATQSGVSYPKYYLWIRAADETGHHVEGAMRVAAIEQVRFDITDFTPADLIRSNPALLASIYPAPLIPAIQQHAEVE